MYSSPQRVYLPMYLFGLGALTAQSCGYAFLCVTFARACACVCVASCTATTQSPGYADVGSGVGRPGDGALRGNRGRAVREPGGGPGALGVLRNGWVLYC